MKALKLVIIAAAILLALFLIVGLFAPKEVEVRRSTQIKAPTAAVFPHLQYFDKMVEWHPWFRKDPNLLQSVKGKDGQVGAIRKWDSKLAEVGTGEETILEVVDRAYIKTDVNIKSPRASRGINQFSLVDANNQTQVIWQFKYTVPYPFNSFLLFGTDVKPLEKLFSQGLQVLKQQIENFEKSAVNYMVNDQDFPGGTYIVRRKTVKKDELNTFAENAMTELRDIRQNAGLKRSGFPVGLIYGLDYEAKTIDYAYGIPVNSTTGLEDEDLLKLAPRSDVKSIFVVDLISNRLDAHKFMEKHMNQAGKNIDYPVIEIYYKGKIAENDTQGNAARFLYWD